MTDDIDRIMAVMTAAFDPVYGEAWSRRQVEDALLVPGTAYLLAGKTGECPLKTDAAAGFALWRTIAGETELLLLAVSPEFRHHGIGTALLDGLLNAIASNGIDRVFLEMRDGNPAGSLYLKAGFKEIGRRPNYYRRGLGEPVDAITFSWVISEKFM